MTRLVPALLALVVALPAAALSQTPLGPEWPRLYPEPVVAPGFRTTGATEFQWRDSQWMAIGRRQWRPGRTSAPGG